MSVCASVRLCVCVCVAALLLKRLCRFWWNFAQMIWQIFTCVIFFDFWKFKFDDVMAAILHFSYGALSRSQFLSDFLQIWIQGIKLFSTVCYWKSAKSVENFWRYNGRKNAKFSPRTKFSNLDAKGIINTNPDPQITNLILFCRFNDNLGRYRGYRGRSSLSFLHFRSKYMHVKRHQKLADDMFCLDNLITNNDSKYKQSIFVYVYKIIVKVLVIYLYKFFHPRLNHR